MAPILALLDFTKTFMPEMDALGTSLGVVLMQDGRPIAYFNHALLDRAHIKSVYEYELMAIVLMVQKWHHYLIGKHFIICMNQKSLHFLMEQRVGG